MSKVPTEIKVDLMTDKDCKCNFINWIEGHENDRMWVLCAYFVWKTNYIAALIPTSLTYEDLLKKSNKITHRNTGKELRRTTRKGYYCKQFIAKEHYKEICEINHSKTIRCGGPMRFAYLYNEEETLNYYNRMEGYTNCPYHWAKFYGVFTKEDKLVGYTHYMRNGELSFYNTFICHGSYFKDCISHFLHFYIQTLIRSNEEDFKDIKVSIYGNWDSTHIDGLQFWKHKGGFEPARVVRVGIRAPEETDVTR